jgi:hypothetical protein
MGHSRMFGNSSGQMELKPGLVQTTDYSTVHNACLQPSKSVEKFLIKSLLDCWSGRRFLDSTRMGELCSWSRDRQCLSLYRRDHCLQAPPFLRQPSSLTTQHVRSSLGWVIGRVLHQGYNGSVSRKHAITPSSAAVSPMWLSLQVSVRRVMLRACTNICATCLSKAALVD